MKYQEKRKQFIKALKSDEGMVEAHIANISCIIMDNVKGYKRDYDKRMALAKKIFDWIFQD